MAKYSMKRDGKEVGPASTYAEPHTMDGKKQTIQQDSAYETGAQWLDKSNPSISGISKKNGNPTKTDGITIRGYGAATKGIKARGPMA
jgi:hypothetical protein